MTKPETQESPETEKTQPPNGGLPPLTLQFIVSIVAAVVVVAAAAGINHAWPIFGIVGRRRRQHKRKHRSSDGGSRLMKHPSSTWMSADAPTKGPKDAKVQIIEFSDFECPYCAQVRQRRRCRRFCRTTATRSYSHSGTTRCRPSMHPYAQKAAEASECANDQGKFWQYHDLLFQNQSQLSAFVQADPTNGVNPGRGADEAVCRGTVGRRHRRSSTTCLDSGADAAKVTSDASAMTDALTKAGVTRFGTPSFFINGKFISGAYPYDENSPGYQAGMFTFKSAIDEALAAAQ